MDRLFLDANVLFSAAYRPDAGVAKLWRFKDAELITSAYALEEARLNLETPEQKARLEKLAAAARVLETHEEAELPEGIKLPAKDLPILQAALAARATHLLTGDFRHFGRYFGKKVAGVLVITPSDYLSTQKG